MLCTISLLGVLTASDGMNTFLPVQTMDLCLHDGCLTLCGTRPVTTVHLSKVKGHSHSVHTQKGLNYCSSGSRLKLIAQAQNMDVSRDAIFLLLTSRGGN